MGSIEFHHQDKALADSRLEVTKLSWATEVLSFLSYNHVESKL